MHKPKCQKKKKKDNYSLAKLFLMRMSLRLLLKKPPTKQQSRQKFVKSHFPQRLKDKFHFESDIRNLKLKRQHGKILPNKSKHLSFCRALGVSVHRFLTGNSVCAIDQVLFFWSNNNQFGTENTGKINRCARVKVGVFPLSYFYILGRGSRCHLEFLKEAVAQFAKDG